MPARPSYRATQLPESLPGWDTAGRLQEHPPSRTVGPVSPSRLTASGGSEETQGSACPPRVRGAPGHRGGPPRDWTTCLAGLEPRAPGLSPQVNPHATPLSRNREAVSRRAGPAGPRSPHLRPSHPVQAVPLSTQGSAHPGVGRGHGAHNPSGYLSSYSGKPTTIEAYDKVCPLSPAFEAFFI